MNRQRIKVKKLTVCAAHNCPCIDGVGRVKCLVCGCDTIPPRNPSRSSK